MCGVVILTTVDIFKLEFISIRFTTFFTLTKISNTKKRQISAYRPFENVSLLYIYFQWVAETTLRTKFPLITSKKCARLLRHVIGHYKIDALTMFFLRLWKFERLMNSNFDKKWSYLVIYSFWCVYMSIAINATKWQPFKLSVRHGTLDRSPGHICK